MLETRSGHRFANGDVRISAPGDFMCSERLRISHGTKAAASDLQPAYAIGAMVPRVPWRCLTPDEETRVFGGRHPAHTVQVCRIPPEAIEGFGPLRTALARDYPVEVLQRVIGSKRTAEAFSCLQSGLGRFGVCWQTIRALGISLKSPGLETCTTESSTGERVGLHVDSFFGDGLSGRERRALRLCINVGIEPRHFLFVNTSLQRIWEVSCDGSREMHQVNASAIAAAFLAAHPNYGVLRLTLLPGEAYIAPTENIIHDSTSADRRTFDAALTFLGYSDGAVSASNHASL